MSNSVFALVRSDNCGQPSSVIETCCAYSEAEAENILGVPSPEAYVASQSDGWLIYRHNFYYVDGPF